MLRGSAWPLDQACGGGLLTKIGLKLFTHTHTRLFFLPFLFIIVIFQTAAVCVNLSQSHDPSVPVSAGFFVLFVL